MDPEIFFPERGESCDEARAVCSTCPVSKECLIYAYTESPRVLGIWGGTSDRQRRRVPGTRVHGSLPQAIKHGTNAGYNQHRRRGETMCDGCRQAHSRYVAMRKAEKRGQVNGSPASRAVSTIHPRDTPLHNGTTSSHKEVC